MKKVLTCLVVCCAVCVAAGDVIDPRVRSYVAPVRVMWVSPHSPSSHVERAEVLLSKRWGQIPEGRFPQGSGCRLVNAGAPASVLLDFGREIHGGLQIGVGSVNGRASSPNPDRVRVRMGESAAEAMAELGERGACNDHALRDTVVELPRFGYRTIGDSGFRFVRIDLLDKTSITVEFVRAVSVMRPMKRLGSFRCSDGRLNRIWNTAADTLHLCCQEYIWDGIKRDRLVWQGDMHPEICSILRVFGPEAREVVQASLDYMRDTTPSDKWMNTMPAYTLWWIRCQRDWWFFTGDDTYLKQQHRYLSEVIANLDKYIGADNHCKLTGFLDWPTQHNKPAVKAGMQALMLTAYRNAAELARRLGDTSLAERCDAGAAKLAAYRPKWENSKAAAAMLSLAGLADSQEMAKHLADGGAAGVSTFYGYYMMEARARSGDVQGAMDTIRDYWGGMLDMGATSFWEDFNIAWTNNAFRIDQLPVSGKKDIHGDYGEFCYRGFRHSLCHGWSSGPAAWMIDHILGVTPLTPGGTKVSVKPFLGSLDWAEGTFPVCGGVLKVSCRKDGQGRLQTSIEAPQGVEVVK